MLIAQVRMIQIVGINNQSNMKSTVALIFMVLIITTLSQKHEALELDKPYQQSLTEENMFTGRYVFAISEDKVKEIKANKWFFFVEVEPNEENQWVGVTIQISIAKKGQENSRNDRVCGNRRGGVDSCYFTNKQFDYKTEEIHANVRCRGPCKFKISGEVSEPYKLTIGEPLSMDFEDTAYSKVFQLDTTNKDSFDQLRIILRPEGFLRFPAPIGLYVNKGSSLPTRKSHDFSSITLWDNGEGVFIDTPEAKGTFTILVQSPEKNVLVLSTELISFKQSYSLNETQPHFDYIGEGSSKLYKCKANPESGMVVKLSTFSGAIKLNRILDAQLKQIDEQFPMLYRSFSEMQYQLQAAFFKQNKEYYKISEYLIFEITGVEESTFLFEYYQLNKGISHLVPQTNRYVQLSPKAHNQYYINVIELNTPEFKKVDIEVIITYEPNKEIKPRFFRCQKQHGSQCQLKNSQLNAEKFDSEGIKEVGQFIKETYGEGVFIYKFSLQAKYFKKASDDVRRYILGVLISNPSDEQRLYTIRYKNVGHNVYLKELQVQKDRISIDEERYYLFTNRQSDIKEVRVHLMQISGRVRIEGYYDDPRTNNLQGQEVTDYRNMLKFTNIKENQTVYIKITGKEAAYYSLQVQLMKETDKEWWNRTHQNKGKFYNEITIFEDIPYQFTIQPFERVVYQVHSKNTEFYLEMSSLLPLDLCMTEQLTKPPFIPNCEVKQKLTKRQIQKVRLERGKIGNIGVTNTNDKVNKFNVKFYAVDNTTSDPSQKVPDNYTAAKCLPAMLGKVTKYSLKQQTSSCYTFMLFKAQDTELTIDLASHQFDKVNIIAAIGQIQRVEIIGEVHIFKKSQIDKACGSLFPCTLKLFIDSQVNSEIRFTAQIAGGVVFLLDGISNDFTGGKTSRHFAYEIMNKINTTVILHNRRGNFNFYGKVVEANKFWSSAVAHPTSSQNTLKSANPFYFDYQIAILTETMITEAKCKECLLLLTVEAGAGSDHKDSNSKFTIECTQQNRFLKESTPITSYLNKHSVSFYEFQNKQEGSVLISINSQNQECATIYVSKGENRPTGSNYEFQSHNNILLIENAEVSRYSITVQARENCYYSIDYTSAANKVYSIIEAGMYTDIRLEKGQNRSLLYHHTENSSFRMVTLHQTGEVLLKAKTYKTIKDYLADDSAKKKYTFSGTDFLRIQNDSKGFCFDCYYEITLSGERQTKTSLIIPTSTSEFPIMVDSIIQEELKKGQVERMRIFTDKLVQFEINVMYGSVNISLQSPENKDSFIFTKIYKANQKTQYEILNNTKDPKTDDLYFMSFTRIVIKAEEDTEFSFGLISDKDKTKRGNRVRYGNPEYVTLQANKQQCLIGRLDDNEQQFLISITGDKQVDMMNNLQISCKLENGKELLELSKEIAKNEMIVKIDKPPRSKLPGDYQFCFKSSSSIFFTFIQSSRLLYLPEATAVVVNGNMNFSFYSQGKSLLEINECKSRAVTTVYHSFSTTDRINSQIKQVRKTNNIIEFMYYGPVYVQVEAKSGTIAWRRKDQLKKIGYGYDQYYPSKIRYGISDGKLKVEVYQLTRSQSQANNVQFQDITYSAVLAYEELNLYEAINCQSGTYMKEAKVIRDNLTKVAFQFDIDKIVQKFGGRRYILVGALVTATSKIEGDGKYRFIYPYQEVPMSALKGQIFIDPEQGPGPVIDDIPLPNPEPKAEEKAQWSFMELLAIGVVLLFVGLVLYRVCLKKILKKRRMQRLSEQGGATGEVHYQQFASYATS